MHPRTSPRHFLFNALCHFKGEDAQSESTTGSGQLRYHILLPITVISEICAAQSSQERGRKLVSVLSWHDIRTALLLLHLPVTSKYFFSQQLSAQKLCRVPWLGVVYGGLRQGS